MIHQAPASGSDGEPKGRTLQSPFLRFACVGMIGFVVDASILTALMRLGWAPVAARLVSFTAAVGTTWLLNKAWTFGNHVQRPAAGYLHYTAVQVVGAGINLGIFSLLIMALPAARAQPWAPLAVAALVALVFNYLTTRHWVFPSPRS